MMFSQIQFFRFNISNAACFLSHRHLLLLPACLFVCLLSILFSPELLLEQARVGEGDDRRQEVKCEVLAESVGGSRREGEEQGNLLQDAAAIESLCDSFFFAPPFPA